MKKNISVDGITCHYFWLNGQLVIQQPENQGLSITHAINCLASAIFRREKLRRSILGITVIEFWSPLHYPSRIYNVSYVSFVSDKHTDWYSPCTLSEENEHSEGCKELEELEKLLIKASENTAYPAV